MSDEKEKFIILRAKGYSFDRIAKELRKSKQTLVNWNKDFEEEISNLKSMELESLYERFYLNKQAKIEAFGGLLTKLKAEIEKRDLSDVSTDKIMDLFLKYYSFMESEKIEPQFKTTGEIEESKEDREALNRLLGISSKELKAV